MNRKQARLLNERKLNHRYAEIMRFLKMRAAGIPLPEDMTSNDQLNAEAFEIEQYFAPTLVNESFFHAYIGEARNGRVKITTDRDCLPADIIRLDERVFVNENDMLNCAMSFRNRGFDVCVDTETIFQDYASEPKEGA